MSNISVPSKIYAMLIFDLNRNLTYRNYNLSDFSILLRSKISNEIEVIAKELISSTKPGSYYKINEKILNYEFVIYGSTPDQFSDQYCIIITNPSYPTQTAYQLLNTIKTEKVNKTKFDAVFIEYQNSQNVDKLYQMQSHLDETKVILLESLSKLHDRGDELKDLQIRTNNMVAESQKFVDISHDLNRCCTIL